MFRSIIFEGGPRGGVQQLSGAFRSIIFEGGPRGGF